MPGSAAVAEAVLAKTAPGNRHCYIVCGPHAHSRDLGGRSTPEDFLDRVSHAKKFEDEQGLLSSHNSSGPLSERSDDQHDPQIFSARQPGRLWPSYSLRRRPRIPPASTCGRGLCRPGCPVTAWSCFAAPPVLPRPSPRGGVWPRRCVGICGSDLRGGAAVPCLAPPGPASSSSSSSSSAGATLPWILVLKRAPLWSNASRGAAAAPPARSFFLALASLRGSGGQHRPPCGAPPAPWLQALPASSLFRPGRLSLA